MAETNKPKLSGWMARLMSAAAEDEGQKNVAATPAESEKPAPPAQGEQAQQPVENGPPPLPAEKADENGAAHAEPPPFSFPNLELPEKGGATPPAPPAELVEAQPAAQAADASDITVA